jgi:hypothetical protein
MFAGLDERTQNKHHFEVSAQAEGRKWILKTVGEESVDWTNLAKRRDKW